MFFFLLHSHAFFVEGLRFALSIVAVLLYAVLAHLCVSTNAFLVHSFSVPILTLDADLDPYKGRGEGQTIKNIAFRAEANDTTGIERCLNFRMLRTQCGRALARKSAEHRTQHFPAQVPDTANCGISHYICTPKGRQTAPEELPDVVPHPGMQNRFVRGPKSHPCQDLCSKCRADSDSKLRLPPHGARTCRLLPPSCCRERLAVPPHCSLHKSSCMQDENISQWCHVLKSVDPLGLPRGQGVGRIGTRSYEYGRGGSPTEERRGTPSHREGGI
jgi:hypothetical protein